MATTPREYAASVAPAQGELHGSSVASLAEKSAAASSRQGVIAALLGSPKNFSFVQAVRLLALCGQQQYGSYDAFLRRGLKVVPELSLAHPPTDIVDIRCITPPSADSEQEGSRETDEASETASSFQKTASAKPPLPRYRIEATFLSLYGTASPLPTFYTEELFEEARQDLSASRDFLDIFSQTLYRLYCKAHTTYKLGFRSHEQRDPRIQLVQYCLMGLGGEALRHSAAAQQSDLRFAGEFSRHARSAAGLQHYLSRRLGHSYTRIEQCVERHMPIPPDQLCRLGRAVLNGENAIGTHVCDRSGKFRIHLHRLDAAGMEGTAPGGAHRASLENAVRKYLNVPLSYDLVRHVAPGTLAGTRLGQTSRLGVNTVLTLPAQNPQRAYVSYRSNP